MRCRHVPDDATCRRFLDPRSFDTRRAADGIRLGRLAYDPEAAAGCLAAGRAAECSALPFLDDSCARVFTGLVAEGQPCASSFDCAAGASCADADCHAGCCIGTCVAVLPPTPEPPPAEIGAPCTTHTDCVDLAYCGDDLRCTPLPRRAGEHCLFGCYFGDLFCHAGSETCRPYAAPGEACGPDALCNPTHSFCDGVCRPRPGPGEACDGDRRRCVPGTNCLAGRCAARGGAGVPCLADLECDVACDGEAGTCTPYIPCLEQAKLAP